MEEERKLYPLGFFPIATDRKWGTETFLLADLGYRDSSVREGWLGANDISDLMDTFIDRIVGEQTYEYYGRQFPITVRALDIHGRTPLTVHPDDETAVQRYDLLGKEKLWYIAEATQGSTIMLGFKEDTDSGKFLAKCSDNTADTLLNTIAVHKGQFFHIAPGTPHCAEGKLLIYEISEASSADACLCDWGKGKGDDEFDNNLDLVEVMDYINYSAYKNCECSHGHKDRDGIVSTLIDIPQMEVHKLNLSDPLHIYTERFESFILYTCISGKASVQMNIDGINTRYDLRNGECLLISEECPDFLLVPEEPGTLLLETIMPHREDKDPYINPDVPECADDECECHHHHKH